MRIAVAGGTGVVGRHVVNVVAEHGHEPVTLARSVGVDLVHGTGVDHALEGVEAVVDVANNASIRRATAEPFFAAVTRTLHEAGTRAGVRHYVVLSIVGIDTVHTGYYRAKQLQERLVLDGPVPATVLRATQFHEFAGQVSARLRGPVVVTPDLRVQPVAARQVAEQLVALAVGPPKGRAGDLGGPRQESLAAMMRAVLRAAGDRRPVVGVRLPIGPLRAVAGGGLLPGPGAVLATQTFAEWLAQRSGQSDG